MTNLKWLRQALLGGAALSVLATGAQADELTALKAQLEALQSRVNQLETASSMPALPPGAKLLSVRKGQGTYAMNAALPAADRLQEHQGYTIAITPTADMPAPVSEVTVSGEIRARMLYRDFEVDEFVDLDADDSADFDEFDFEEQDFDITTRGRLRVDGRTETAIGEVGGTLRIQATQNAPGSEDRDIQMNIIWGYWQMTPNFQLGAGFWDSLAAIQAGWDWNGEPALVGLNAGPTNKSVSQFRITYSNGGLTLAASLEDNNNRESDLFDVDAVFPAVAGYVAFDSGSFLVTASAVWESDDTDTFADTEDNWMVGVGAIIRLSDMFRLEGAANIGEGYTAGIYTLQNAYENDFEYWSANVLAVISFAEAMRVELGAAYSDVDHENDELFFDDDQVEKAWTVGASLFWDPVDQLTLGWGVGFTNREDEGGHDADELNAGFGAWFRF
jgi:hypothetical protein